MFKWVSWVIRMGATALLLSFLCIWTTGYIVNSYMESVVKGLDLPIEIQPIALSGVWGTLWGADKKPKAEAEETNTTANTTKNTTANEENRESAEASNGEPEPKHSQAGGIPAEEPSGEPGDQAEPGVAPDGGEEGPEGEASPSPGPGPDSAEEGEGSVPVFNGEEAIGQLTDSDRQALYAMVVSKLDPEQLELLSEALKDGVTSEELTQVQEMLKTSLTEGEYSQMMELLQGVEIPETEATPE